MTQTSRVRQFRMRYILADAVAVLLVYLIFNCIRYRFEDTSQSFSELTNFLFNIKFLWVGAVFFLFWMGTFTLSGYYNRPIQKSRITEFFTTLASTLVGAVVVFLGLVVDDIVDNPELYLRLFFILAGLTFVIVYCCRLSVTNYGIRIARQSPDLERILLIGNGATYAEMPEKMKCMRREVVAAVKLPLPGGETGSEDYPGSEYCDMIAKAVDSYRPDSIVVTMDARHAEHLALLLYKLYPFCLPVRVSSHSLLFSGSKTPTLSLLNEPMVDMTDINMSEFGQNVKWLFDKVFSLLMLLFTSPLLLYIAVRVKRSSPGSIFFAQERIGRHGKPFMIYKFRTMYLGAEPDGPQLSSDADKRITPVGRALRKYRLDELPQFWNVLRGDMSVVGPRPERLYYIRRLVQRAPYYYLLHNVSPGITSWGMVRYGYASTTDEMLERLTYDWLYYENMSLRLDVAVLLYTVKTLIKGTGK